MCGSEWERRGRIKDDRGINARSSFVRFLYFQFCRVKEMEWKAKPKCEMWANARKVGKCEVKGGKRRRWRGGDVRSEENERVGMWGSDSGSGSGVRRRRGWGCEDGGGWDRPLPQVRLRRRPDTVVVKSHFPPSPPLSIATEQPTPSWLFYTQKIFLILLKTFLT